MTHMTSPKIFQDNVRNLYENLPFPLRNPHDEKQRLLITPTDVLSKINHYCFQGKESFGSGFRAMVAGGGTGDALIYLAHQLSERGGEVTYLDMSTQSMEIAKQRASMRGLKNIKWVHASLLDIPQLDLGKFDYINCVGVLHHLNSPAEGLACLEEILSDNGGMSLMLYGRYGRMGITVLQNMLQLILKNEYSLSESVNVAESLLRSLAPTNAYMRGRDRAYVLNNLKEDPNNLADIFLHPCDHSFTASEFTSLIENSGLFLTAFTTYDGNPAITRLQYDPVFMAWEDAIKPYLQKLSFLQQLDIAEMMDGNLHLHTAYVSRKKEGSVADFSNSSNIPFFPNTYAEQAIFALKESGTDGIMVQLSSGCLITIKPNMATLAFLNAINDSLSLGEIISMLELSGHVISNISNDLSILNALDWILLRHKSIGPFPVVGSSEKLNNEKLLSNLGPKPWTILNNHPLVQI